MRRLGRLTVKHKSSVQPMGASHFVRRAIVASTEDDRDRVTKWICRIARIWSLVIIGITLVVVIAHVVVPEVNGMDYPPSENLLPLAMCLSVAGLGVAWRWEGLGGLLWDASTAELIVDTLGIGQAFLPLFSAITSPATNFLVAFGFGLVGTIYFALFGQDLGRAEIPATKTLSQRSKRS